MPTFPRQANPCDNPSHKTEHNPIKNDAELGVIIPCRNEASILPALLSDLAAQTSITLNIWLADGQSHDNSIAVAKAAGASRCSSPPGRGLQMNTAAALASNAWLLFLHADSRLSHPQQLRHALDQMKAQESAAPNSDTIAAGHFALQFIDRPRRQRRWRVLEYKTASNRPLTISGDQGLLIRRKHFEALGGFNTTLPFLEDQIIAAQIQQQGQWHLLPHPLKTSARRFQTQGFAGRYLLMTLIMLAYRCQLRDFLNPQLLYPEQNQARKVVLADHIRRFHGCAFKQNGTQIIQTYWRVAGEARENAYQITLWLDALMGWPHWPLSKLWQKGLEPVLALPVIKQGWQCLLLPVMPLISLFCLLASNLRR